MVENSAAVLAVMSMLAMACLLSSRRTLRGALAALGPALPGLTARLYFFPACAIGRLHPQGGGEAVLMLRPGYVPFAQKISAAIVVRTQPLLNFTMIPVTRDWQAAGGGAMIEIDGLRLSLAAQKPEIAAGYFTPDLIPMIRELAPHGLQARLENGELTVLLAPARAGDIPYRMLADFAAALEVRLKAQPSSFMNRTASSAA